MEAAIARGIIISRRAMVACTLLLLVAVSFESSSTRLYAANPPYTTVGQSNNSEGTLGVWIRHNFYANGRHWVWWSTANPSGSLVYASSVDGVNWDPPIQVLGPGIISETFAPVWFNGSHVMYLGSFLYSGGLFVFRMGVPEANGSIFWVAPQQTISTSAPIFSDVKTDSNGYVWISYTTLSPMHTYVMQNQMRDGTWKNGTQYKLDQQSFYNYLPTDIIPLSSGKMYFTYNSNTCSPWGFFGRIWDRAAIGMEETITGGCPSDLGYSSAVGVGDSVYVAYGEDGGSIHFSHRSSNGGWSPEFLLQSSGNTTIVSLSVVDDDHLVALWQGGDPANTVFYRVYTISSNSWSSVIVWFMDPEGFTPVVGAIKEYSRPGSFYEAYGNSTVRNVGFQYATKSTQPYNVKYALLSIKVRATSPPPANGNPPFPFNVVVGVTVIAAGVLIAGFLVVRRRRVRESWYSSRSTQRRTSGCSVT